jgi:hypothetical protein
MPAQDDSSFLHLFSGIDTWFVILVIATVVIRLVMQHIFGIEIQDRHERGSSWMDDDDVGPRGSGIDIGDITGGSGSSSMSSSMHRDDPRTPD